MKGQERLRRQLADALKGHLARPKSRPRVPEAGAILWCAFLELDAARQMGPHGPQPIGFQEIEAWCRLKGVPLQPHHVDTLRALDSVLIGHFMEQARKATEAMKRRGRGRPTISPAMFDSMA